MTSRLDRLFVLLESGSSAATRKAAAQQLGQVQKLHPHELHNLLARISVLLKSTSWDTRIAAGQAVEAVVKNVPPWDPQPNLIKREEVRDSGSGGGRMTFQSFDLNKILMQGAHLVGSEGKEFDAEENGLKSSGERIAQQKAAITEQLGVTTEALDDLITDDDLDNQIQSEYQNKKSVASVVNESMVNTGMSSREMNRAKRVARLVAKQKSRENQDDCDNDCKRAKVETKTECVNATASQSVSSCGNLKIDEQNLPDSVPDSTGSWGEHAVEWPFENFCEQLGQDLLSAGWEIRHGAATALREVIKVHGNGSGKAIDLDKKEMENNHNAWLEDISLRIICVLALDRFGDFVSDQVVAPVRETCAQTLGVIVRLMHSDAVVNVAQVLLTLLNCSEWEARHGGLLGLKYLLAVKGEDPKLLPLVLPAVLKGLDDSVEDVGAVAAAALIPAATELAKRFPGQLAPTVQRLWELLAEQDELAAASNSFMGLLASLLSQPAAQYLHSAGVLTQRLPVLWPFLSHASSAVRRSTLETLSTLASGSISLGLPAVPGDPSLLQHALRHVFQRALLETDSDIQSLAEKVWEKLLKNCPLDEVLHAACPFISTWLCLAMQPNKMSFDPNMLLTNRLTYRRSKPTAGGNDDGGDMISVQIDPKFYIGGGDSVANEFEIVRARCMVCRMLGLLSTYVVQPMPGLEQAPNVSPLECYVKVLVVHLQSKSALQRLVVGLVIAEWARIESQSAQHPDLIARLHQCLTENVYYDEIALSFTKLLQETKDFIAMMRHYRVPLQEPPVLTLEQISILSSNAAHALTQGKLKPKNAESLEERRKAIQNAVSQTSCHQSTLAISTQAALAGAVTMLGVLPERLNPVVKPLMDSIKKEQCEPLQKLAAEHLTKLIELCVNREPNPNQKVVSNLCTFLRSDPEFTPFILKEEKGLDGEQSINIQSNKIGILMLINQQKAAERAVLKRYTSVSGRGPGRPPTIIASPEFALEELMSDEDESQKQKELQRRGATVAIAELVSQFGVELPIKLPKLWEAMFSGLQTSQSDPAQTPEIVAENLIAGLQVLEIVVRQLNELLLPQIELRLSEICNLLQHEFRGVRYMSSRVLAALSCRNSVSVVKQLIDQVLPSLAAPDIVKRQGAVEAVACLVDALGINVVPYAVLLVVPLLGRMSDQDSAVRMMATNCFATLIQLMPLDGGVPEPKGLNEVLGSKRAEQKRFLEQLFSPSTIEDYVVPVPLRATLRSYQQAGINWLAFLNKYNLHGILCDDMGLGKTLQSICMLAGDHYYREQEYKKTKAPDCAPLPSLCICPPTLVGHWVDEVEKFLSNQYLNPLQYVGPPLERERLQKRFKYHNLIVASYDVVRKDISFFKSMKWNYCILDEGHVIKNGKTKSSKAIKQLRANHRLILSGTPIQNNVLELWSLFDFLMPSFLGTEKQFTARYSRPIIASRDPKSSSREQEAGVLAMETLHRQVLPFLLRRMKEDVLKDLPPKITQDYFCELSSLQQQLYEDFQKTQVHQTLHDSLVRSPNDGATTNKYHIFQALHYLQNVCNHPKLVLTQQHPQYEAISKQLKQQNTSLNDIQHAAKLPALKQLLLDCGIGVPSSADQTEAVVVNQHRALIFCQLKAMLDIVEKDLLRTHMPEVTYLRLDGSVPAGLRQSVVSRFNSDPSIDVLLLTTQVGGLGLNLTGADTVIFVEHDWNPMKDLQAMDRAHRIGQKKVVNVYRLITRATLEEKIMGLQKFKLLTANTVINSENNSLESMGSIELLDLFMFEKKDKDGSDASTSQKPNTSASNMNMNSVLKSLPALWESTQYDEEYDLSNFLQNLKK